MADRSKKKTFDLRMSKKVAELTQVVHMLFVKNHEREMEAQYLKEAYENELDRQHKKYKNQLENEQKLHSTKLEELTLKNQNDSAKEKLRQQLEEEKVQYKKRLEEIESQLANEKREGQQLRTLLIKSEQDISQLKTTIEEMVKSQSSDTVSRERELQQLKKQNVALERKVSENSQHHLQVVESLNIKLQEMDNECASLSVKLHEARLNEESALKRSRLLEQDTKKLKFELSQKLQEINSLRRPARRSPSPSQQFVPQLVYDELESLRKQVQRYRLELSNREGNFNRMFTDQSPVLVDRRSGKAANRGNSRHASAKDKSFTDSLSQSYDTSFSAQERLPRVDNGTKSFNGLKRAMPNKQLLAHYSQNFKT